MISYASTNLYEKALEMETHEGNISKIEDETLAVGSKDVFDHITKQDMIPFNHFGVTIPT